MFCRNCGQEIGDARFCRYCGTAADGTGNGNTAGNQNNFFASLGNTVKKIGHGQLCNWLSVVFSGFGIVNRVLNNEIFTEFHILAQDDFLVISENGRTYGMIAVLLHSSLSAWLLWNAKKEQVSVPKKSFIVFALSLVIQVLAMTLRLPAPY